MIGAIVSFHPHHSEAQRMSQSAKSSEPKQKVWLVDEQITGIVRKVEVHPIWGKQFLVTTHSNDWGPETFWVKESNVEEMRGRNHG